MVSAAAVLATGYGMQIKMNGLTENQIERLNAGDVNRFDRHATKRYSRTADHVSDAFLFGSGALALSLVIPKQIRSDYLIIGTLLAQTLLINNGITTLVKATVKRNRPLAYNSHVDLEVQQDKSARLSFFSGHTSTTAALCFFSAKVLHDYFPDTKLRPLIWSLGVAIPLTTAYLRYHAGKHFPTDLIAGFTMGALSGWLVPHLHKKDRKRSRLSLVPIVSPEMKGLYARLSL